MKRSSALVFTLLLVLLLVANSADFLFRQSYYEVWDSAANSLSVIRAKHFAQLYGPYSRWSFYHPGPALFYIQALGEWLFYDTLHWTHTPFPAQTIAHLAVMCAFFVATLMIFSNWLPAGRPRWWFLCGSLIVAVLHFTAMTRIPSYDVVQGPSAFLSMWSAHALVLPFLCLLTAGASIAGGRGEDLPALALASGYLLQLHVAEPMFVGPVFTLGYIALLWRTSQGSNVRAEPSEGQPGDPRRSFFHRLGRAGNAWRAFPRAHWIAALILTAFALPFLVDFCKGSESNLAAILRHVQEYDTHKPFERAWFHFLQFGAYTPYVADDNEFAAYDHAGMFSYLRAHVALYALWSSVLAAAGWALLAEWRANKREQAAGPVADPAVASAAAGIRFRAWAALVLFLAVALTLHWNTRQDGQMFYFNSWFTFAIYYFAALIALAVACAHLPGTTTAWSSPAWLERALGSVAVLAVAGYWAGSLRLVDPGPAATRAMHEDILRVEAATRAAAGKNGISPMKALCFEYYTSAVAVAVALQLERDHVPFVTEERWSVFMGEDHRWSRLSEQRLRAGRIQAWRFAHQADLPKSIGGTDSHLTTVGYLLDFFHQPDDIVIRSSDPLIDPALPDGVTINLLPDGNGPQYIVGGWRYPEPEGTWTDAAHAVFGFRPIPVPEDGRRVEIMLRDIMPSVDRARGSPPQQVRLFFDGEPLEPEMELTKNLRTFVYYLSAAQWNRQGKEGDSLGHLLMLVPDAAAGNSRNYRKEGRPAGVSVGAIRFRLKPGTSD